MRHARNQRAYCMTIRADIEIVFPYRWFEARSMEFQLMKDPNLLMLCVKFISAFSMRVLHTYDCMLQDETVFGDFVLSQHVVI